MKITVKTTPTWLCKKNPYRKALTIVNLSDDYTLYVGDANVSTSGEHMGIPIYPKFFFTLSEEEKECQEEWYGIAEAEIEVIVKETL